jgi:hypothetical protein
MPDTVPTPVDSEIGLAEMIEDLRSELTISLERGKSSAVSFEIDKVELELKVGISRKQKGEGGVAFWVVKAGASLEAGRDTIHTFTLTLAPVVSATGERLKVRSSTSEAPPRD